MAAAGKCVRVENRWTFLNLSSKPQTVRTHRHSDAFP